MTMSWDDLRFVLAVKKHGSLARAARALGVDHTTVGRRVDAAEDELGVRLFTRTTTGFVPTVDAERLLPQLLAAEDAVLAVVRGAHARDQLEGPLRVTSPETFGVSYLAPRLATFAAQHPSLRVELVPAGMVLDLGRGEAEIAVRMFRSKGQNLVVKKVGAVVYGLYGAESYLQRRPLKNRESLADHALLSVPGDDDVEAVWLRRLCPAARPGFTSDLSLALVAAVVAGAGLAVLPRYLGDNAPGLRHLPMPDPPAQPIWLTVHKDLRQTPRVRALLDHLAVVVAADAALLSGR